MCMHMHGYEAIEQDDTRFTTDDDIMKVKFTNYKLYIIIMIVTTCTLYINQCVQHYPNLII